MQRLPGRLELAPADPRDYLRQMAHWLPRIHGLDINGAPTYESWLTASALEVPSWSTRPDLWRAAIDLVSVAEPVRDRCFVHRDYQQFNVLWARGAVSGIVDWTWASCAGPPDLDVSHCRLNLAALFSAEWAEQFRLAYEAEAGRQVDPWWDIAGLTDYLPGGWDRLLQEQAGRRLRVDAGGMHDRVEAVLQAALARC